MRTLLLFLAFISLTSVSMAAEKNKKVYTWTDNQGVIHYSDRPVQGKDSKILSQTTNNNIATLAPSASQWQEDYQKNKEDQAEEQKLLDENNEQKEAYCLQIEKRIELFERGGRLYNKSVSGERSFYSDDDIAKEIKQLNKEKKKKCR